jgi:hypothetical protein
MSNIPSGPFQVSGQKSSKADPRRSERWIKAIGFGAYILAACGVLFYAVTFRGVGWSWAELRSYDVRVVIVAVLLFLLSQGQTWLKTTRISDKSKKLFATVILGLFLIIVATVVLWLVMFILRDAGVLANNEQGSADLSCAFGKRA